MEPLEYKHVRELLERGGIQVIVDGQFGSTGKGVIASALANFGHYPRVISNAGPNSGHTFHHEGEKHVLMQLPTYAVKAHLMGMDVPAHLSAGAIIDVDRLIKEIERYPGIRVYLSPFAAVARPEMETDIKDRIGSTGKGTGSGLVTKINRVPMGVLQAHAHRFDKYPNVSFDRTECFEEGLVEVSQGYSLGIDAGFYPYTTSRNCTVMQALSDAGIHPDHYEGSIMTVRTYPIRVGGNSGPGYPDQEEITWEDLGVEPERTTVTNKIRRVFTWSDQQYREALLANRPDVIFVNFCNYLKNESETRDFLWHRVYVPYEETLGFKPLAILVGMGPHDEDVFWWDEVPF